MSHGPATINQRGGTGARLRDAAGTPRPFPQNLWESHAQPALHTRETTFRVLASSSAGNCSIIVRGSGKTKRVILVDAGLSPLKTRRALSDLGLTLDHIDHVVFTHLDNDHCRTGWIKALPRHARFMIHRAHMGRAHRAGLLRRKTTPFDDGSFDVAQGVRARSVHLAHDDLGVAALRFDFDGEASTLGYATDLGRVTQPLIDAMGGVDVLAIESNYCPVMQRESDRPSFLKDRITNGAGHLSNEESAHAVRLIEPKRAVLLHLSRDCNSPERAGRAHDAHAVPITIAHHSEPTDPHAMH
ncbi:MAG: MBL fold metallo-hydrolase [Planctomycetota bacterium]